MSQCVRTLVVEDQLKFTGVTLIGLICIEHPFDMHVLVTNYTQIFSILLCTTCKFKD